MVKLNNKGQALPLNTIVIALLVVVVLVVVIVAFTSNMGSSNQALQDNSASNVCATPNPALSVFPGMDFESDKTAVKCANEGGKVVPGVPGVGKTGDVDNVCCAIPKSDS